MKLREALARCDRLQQSRLFKIAASIVVAAIAAITMTTYVVARTAPAEPTHATGAPSLDEETLSDTERMARSALESTGRTVREILEARSDPTSVGLGLAVGTGLALVVIWMGLGLTYLGILAFVGALAYPLMLWEPTRGVARLLLGAAALTAAFTALLRLVRVLFAHSDPVSSIARTVLAEAVRMRISLIFIVVLILGLAALPGALDADQPLRYRVQAFLSFGTGISFWVVAVMTLLFAAGTVAFDQRDKTIWQTMTKPVAPWQYVLGKWAGVCGLNAVLLGVCACGVFLFTEYLRGQPALGEREAYVAMTGEDVTEDRLILETQVLAARLEITPEVPLTRASPEFLEGVQQYIDLEREGNEGFARSPSERAKIEDDLYKSYTTAFFSIEPANGERYRFTGLASARDANSPLTFRHRVDAGQNRPDQFYMVTFIFGDGYTLVQRMSPGYFHSATIPPSLIDDTGSLSVQVFNGDLIERVPNEDTITFPPGGFELSYSKGSYRLNYLRAVVLLWVKLAFLAAITIWAATFLSFPVACLVAFGVFLAAEGSGYLAKSLQYFAVTDTDGKVRILNVIAANVTNAVSSLFGVYAGLQPTSRISEGRLISLGDVALGASALLAATGGAYALAVLTMRRRELATYSGR